MKRVGSDQVASQFKRCVAASSGDRAAGNKKEGAQAGLAVQATATAQQAVVASVDLAVFQPHPGHVDVLQEAPGFKRLAGMRQPQRGDVQAHEFGPRRKLQRQAVFGQATVVTNGFRWQPFQAGAWRQVDPGALQRERAVRPVEPGRPGRGDQAVRVFPYADVQVECVAANQAARRMHQNIVANRIAFRVQALQDAQGPVVLVTRDGTGSFQTVVQLQSGLPGHKARRPQVF